MMMEGKYVYVVMDKKNARDVYYTDDDLTCAWCVGDTRQSAVEAVLSTYENRRELNRIAEYRSSADTVLGLSYLGDSDIRYEMWVVIRPFTLQTEE